MRFARRQCLGFSAGLFRRFVVRLSAPEYQLWVIADGSIEEPMCRAVAESFLRQRPCCLGYFGRRLRQFLPDVASMLSPLGRATIASWLRTMVWMVYAYEKEHASCRRLLQGAGPSRNWTLCARERLLECSRTVHMERTTCDPARALPVGKAGLTERLAAAVGGATRPVASPLSGIAEEPPQPRAIGFEIEHVDICSDMSSLARAPAGVGAAAAAEGIEVLWGGGGEESFGLGLGCDRVLGQSLAIRASTWASSPPSLARTHALLGCQGFVGPGLGGQVLQRCSDCLSLRSAFKSLRAQPRPKSLHTEGCNCTCSARGATRCASQGRREPLSSVPELVHGGS